MHKLLTSISIFILFAFCFNSLAAAAGNSLYNKLIVKQRAERYAENGGVSPNGRDLYIYTDDEDVENTLDEIKANNHFLDDAGVKIASPTIKKRSKIKNVNVVVDSRKGINIDRTLLGIKKRDVSIANPTIEKGSKVKKVNILVDAKSGGIKVK